MKKFKLNRFIVVAFVLMMTIQIVITVGVGSFSMSMIQKQQEESVNYILSMYSRSLNSVLNESDSDLQDILGSRSTLKLLKDRSDLQRWHASYDLIELLNEKKESTEDVDAYVIMDGVYQGFLMSRTSYINYKDVQYIKHFLERYSKKDMNSTGWISAYIGEKGYLWRGYNYNGVCIAALISEKRLEKIITSGNEDTDLMEFYVTGTDKDIIYSTNEERKYGEKAIENEWTIGVKHKIYEREVQDGAYYLIANIRMPGIWGQSFSFFVLFGMLVTSLIFIVAVLHFMRREIINPVKILADTSEKIRGGDMSIRPRYSCRNMEMDQLKDTYITMLDTIIDLKMKEYERVIQVKESELKYMHMQLKPHFFLNALSTINSMAYQNRNDDIHEFIQVFSQNIRYMFRVGLYTVRLEEETTNVEEYLQMQSLLYKDSFYYYLEVPDELKDYPIPQMLLHTFIENIFKHVISMDSFTTIFLQCFLENYQDEEMLKITIQNSGQQMEPQILKRVNENHEVGSAQSGIGLMNTKEILKIMYGREELLKIENAEPDGTVVTVWIPKETKMEFKEDVK